MNEDQQQNDPFVQQRGFPNAWQAIWVLVAYLALQMLIVLVLMPAFGIVYSVQEPMTWIIVTLLSSYLLVIFLLHYMGINWQQLFAPLEQSNSLQSMLVLLSFPLILFSSGAMVWIGDITSLLTAYFPPSEEEIELLYSALGHPFFAFITACLIAPIVEEVIFRGIILRGFLFHYSATFAIILSSLLFAVFHMTIVQLPVAFILGCLFAWLYYKTGSLWPSIIAHAINNTIAIALQFTLYADYDLEQALAAQPSYNHPLVTIIALIVSGFGLYMLVKLFAPQSSKPPE